MFGVGLLVMVVALRRFAEEFCKNCDVHCLCSLRLPFATGKPRLNFLEQPTVAIRILERCERKVRTPFRIASAYARIFAGVVERPASEVENLAHLDASSDQVFARGVDVGNGKRQAFYR